MFLLRFQVGAKLADHLFGLTDPESGINIFSSKRVPELLKNKVLMSNHLH
jgi:hypothetical protein